MSYPACGDRVSPGLRQHGHRGLATRRRHRAELVGQLGRASTSVVLNLAEGAGNLSKPDKRRFTSGLPAPGSATESPLRSTSACASPLVGETEHRARKGHARAHRVDADQTRATPRRQRAASHARQERNGKEEGTGTWVQRTAGRMGRRCCAPDRRVAPARLPDEQPNLSLSHVPVPAHWEAVAVCHSLRVGGRAALCLPVAMTARCVPAQAWPALSPDGRTRAGPVRRSGGHVQGVARR